MARDKAHKGKGSPENDAEVGIPQTDEMFTKTRQFPRAHTGVSTGVDKKQGGMSVVTAAARAMHCQEFVKMWSSVG